jgi:hypothetical protein
MKLTAHIIEAKPTGSDPLAQRGHVALIWDADKELLEVSSDLQPIDLAAHVALRVAEDVFYKMSPSTDNRTARTAMAEAIERTLERSA